MGHWSGRARLMPDPYTAIAEEVKREPKVMHELADWFDSGKARSGYQFGLALGRADEENQVAIVSSWLARGRCQEVVAGYLRGIVDRLGALPAEWTKRLDAAAADF